MLKLGGGMNLRVFVVSGIVILFGPIDRFHDVYPGNR